MGRSTGADPAGQTASAPPDPCWVPGWAHPEQPWSREEPAALPLPGRVLGYRNLLKCSSPSLAGPSKFGAYSFTLWASGTSEAV